MIILHLKCFSRVIYPLPLLSTQYRQDFIVTDVKSKFFTIIIWITPDSQVSWNSFQFSAGRAFLCSSLGSVGIVY